MKQMIFSLLLLLGAFFANAQSANMKTVMDGYAKFGAGDIPGIIASLDPNIVWIHAGDKSLIPFAGTYNGAEGVGKFFETVGTTTQITVFSPTNFKEEGNMVWNDTHIEGAVIATGKPYSDDVVMKWTFGADGKVTGWEAIGEVAGLTAASKK